MEYFELDSYEEKDIPAKEQQELETGEIVFRLSEKDRLRHPEEGHTYRLNGYFEASAVRDFPLRDKKVTLLIRRRRWIDETTGKSIGNTYDLVAEVTRHMVEFAAFSGYKWQKKLVQFSTTAMCHRMRIWHYCVLGVPLFEGA